MNKLLLAGRITLAAMGIAMIWAGFTQARMDREMAQQRQQMLLNQGKLMIIAND